MSKYRIYFLDMVKTHKKMFDEFKVAHDNYVKDSGVWQKEFNEKGEPVLEVIRQYEKRLCAHSEGSGYAKFSSNLADKFWQEVRLMFPKIDFVGVM